MSRLARLIDPLTGDVQSAAGGVFVVAPDLASKILFSYSIALGSWEGDPTMGHRLDELAQEIDTVETRQRVKDLAAEAVEWLIKSGELSSVEVDVQSVGAGIVAFQPRCYAPGSSSPVPGIGLISIGGG